MTATDWILRDPLRVLKSVDDPYLMTALGTLGPHELTLHFAPDAGRGPDFRVFLDGEVVFELGMAAPGAAWFRLCQEQGYDPERHWDLDPVLILFRQVVPSLAQAWQEQPLPYGDAGFPDGVVSLATVQAAWAHGLAGLPGRSAAEAKVAACLRALPLRAVVFHDNPGHREDFVGTGVDDPLLGVFVHFGQPDNRVTLSKATVNATGGLRWSPWVLGGDWAEEGREWQSTQGPEAFLAAAGLLPAVAGFREAFAAALAEQILALEAAVEAWRRALPASVPWHRDPINRYLNHLIVAVRREHGRAILVLDDGSVVAVAEDAGASEVAVSEPAGAGLDR